MPVSARLLRMIAPLLAILTTTALGLEREQQSKLISVTVDALGDTQRNVEAGEQQERAGNRIDGVATMASKVSEETSSSSHVHGIFAQKTKAASTRRTHGASIDAKIPTCQVPSSAEDNWRMWGTTTCQGMQDGWRVCTNKNDVNHATVMANCPVTCARARGDCTAPCHQISSAESNWRMWGTTTCQRMQDVWKVCTNKYDANHATVMANCPATCARARGECATEVGTCDGVTDVSLSWIANGLTDACKEVTGTTMESNFNWIERVKLNNNRRRSRSCFHPSYGQDYYYHYGRRYVMSPSLKFRSWYGGKQYDVCKCFEKFTSQCGDSGTNQYQCMLMHVCHCENVCPDFKACLGCTGSLIEVAKDEPGNLTSKTTRRSARSQAESGSLWSSLMSRWTTSKAEARRDDGVDLDQTTMGKCN